MRVSEDSLVWGSKGRTRVGEIAGSDHRCATCPGRARPTQITDHRNEASRVAFDEQMGC